MMPFTDKVLLLAAVVLALAARDKPQERGALVNHDA
jgi:hypothetical protein